MRTRSSRRLYSWAPGRCWDMTWCHVLYFDMIDLSSEKFVQTSFVADDVGLGSQRENLRWCFYPAVYLSPRPCHDLLTMGMNIGKEWKFVSNWSNLSLYKYYFCGIERRNGLEYADEIAPKHDVMPCYGLGAWFLRHQVLALIIQGCFPFTVIPQRCIIH